MSGIIDKSWWSGHTLRTGFCVAAGLVTRRSSAWYICKVGGKLDGMGTCWLFVDTSNTVFGGSSRGSHLCSSSVLFPHRCLTLKHVHTSHRNVATVLGAAVSRERPRPDFLPLYPHVIGMKQRKLENFSPPIRPGVIDPMFTFSCPFVFILDFLPNWGVTATFPD